MVKGNDKGKKQTRFKTYRNASGKTFIALAIANAAVAGTAGVQSAEASTYKWNKFEVIKDEETLQVVTSNMESHDFSDSISEFKKQGYDDFRIQTFFLGHPTDEDGMILSGSIFQHQLVGYKYKKGSLLGTVTGGINNYLNNARNSDGFWYELGQKVNEAPTTPTLTVPAVQFEHGDKHFISYGSTDPDGDSITYTLQVNYNNSGNWEQVYKGTQKVYEYTVPQDKISVQFRVIASDGQATSAYLTSPVKDIRDVQYYWSKYDVVNPTVWGSTRHSNAEASVDWSGETSYNREWNEMGLPSFPYGSRYDQLSYSPEKGFYYSNGQDPVEVRTNNWGELIMGLIPYNTPNRQGYFDLIIHANGGKTASYSYKEKISNPNVFERGSLITNSLQGGYNKYQHGVRNTDGYWYERGQRVLSDDVTPPVIELTEQSEVGATSTVDVKVFDLSAIKTFKYVKGEQGSGYFAANGTAITNGKFTVNENGKYTVYAEDARGNKSVQVIEVKKVNTAPVVISAEAVDKFNVVDDSSNFIVQGSISDVDGQPLLAKAIYNSTTVLASTDNNHTFKAMLKGMDYQKGFHNSEISIVANDA